MIRFNLNPVDIHEGELTCIHCPDSKILHKTKEGDIAYKCLKDEYQPIRVIPIRIRDCPYHQKQVEEKKKIKQNKPIPRKNILKTPSKYEGAGYIQKIFDDMEKRNKK